MSNLIMAPRREALLFVKVRKVDGGAYSCVSNNTVGELGNFTV